MHKLTIKPILGNNFHDYRCFFNKKISQIYEEFTPKRVKKDCDYEYNKKQIEIAIQNETNEKKIIYKIMEYAYFLDFFYAFLEDKDYIIIEIENNTFEILEIKGFKTFKDFNFNDINKEMLKKDMKEILLEKIGKGQKTKANEKIDKK